ncbi:type II secretion system protein GspD [Fibrobacter sp. UWR2]|uniref:type II secretion system protein GspD n=1 Tax=Fibrobacter sp. UWR2 TaxID=1964352 RepID=UPI0011821139|nr:secretin N-terminal domain-containing protein [Fibrobacter sp. UWR2]
MPRKNMEESRGCFMPAVACLVIVLLLCLGRAWCAERDVPDKVSLDFVDANIQEVARSVSLAYGVPVLVDGGIENKVTFHLDGVGLLEGLTSLCSTLGLEVFRDGSVLRIRKRVDHGENYFRIADSLVTLAVERRDVRDFIRDFSANTGLNVLAAPDVSGEISGRLSAVPAVTALRTILEIHGFRVRRDADCYRVERSRNTPVGGAGASGSVPDIAVDDSLYSVELDGTSLDVFLKEFARVANLNLVLYGDVHETSQMRFERAPLANLLQSLFRGSRYTYALNSNTLFVTERGAKNVLSRTELYPLKATTPESLVPQLSKLLPGSGLVVSEVKEQNALMLRGSPTEIAEAIAILENLDKPAMQVTISCVIVELKRGRNFEIGLHSGSTRKTGENDLGVRGFWDFMGKDVSASGAFGKIGILPARFEMELSAMEENNRAEILARPRLTTLNGNKAELNVTNTVYYLVSQVSADGYPITDYRSFNDGISLEITPTVTQGGSITLNISPEIKTAGRSSGDGPRDISTRNLKTTVTLKNGETLCLGGLVRKGKSEVRTAVPFLGSIPFIGKLFSYVSEVDDESELAIFITPEVNF